MVVTLERGGGVVIGRVADPKISRPADAKIAAAADDGPSRRS